MTLQTDEEVQLKFIREFGGKQQMEITRRKTLGEWKSTKEKEVVEAEYSLLSAVKTLISRAKMGLANASHETPGIAADYLANSPKTKFSDVVIGALTGLTGRIIS